MNGIGTHTGQTYIQTFIFIYIDFLDPNISDIPQAEDGSCRFLRNIGHFSTRLQGVIHWERAIFIFTDMRTLNLETMHLPKSSLNHVLTICN
jgi:hypothetical protein